MSICNLCKEEKKLIDTSHIISNFLHSELYDEKHKLIKFNPEELKKSDDNFSTPPSATYEGGILCNKCDNETIGKYETYISNVLKGNLSAKHKISCTEVKNSHGLKITEVVNLNYTKTKLFLLSILWRAHISSKQEFSTVNLGPYAEKMRLQIFEGKASGEDEFQISILKFEKGANFSTFIGSPLKHSTEKTSYYSIIILGYVIFFHLRETQISKDMELYSLKENGKLAICQLPKEMVGKFVMGYTGIVKNLKL
jgi:hypothetical protein